MELKPCPFCGFPVDYVSGSAKVNGGKTIVINTREIVDVREVEE